MTVPDLKSKKRRFDSSKNTDVADDVVFRINQIALDLIDREKANGIEVVAWTADELYGRDGAFPGSLAERNVGSGRFRRMLPSG